MKDARGLDVTGNDAAAVAAAGDFAARLLRLDQGVEAILDAAKRWPDTPIVQLYAAAFWLYGQTDGAVENAAAHLRACDALAMNARARAPSGAHALAWQRQSARRRGAGGDHHRVAARPLDRQDRGVPLLRAWSAIHGPAISRAHAPSRRPARGRSGFSRDGGVRQRAVRRLRHRRGVRGTRARHRAEEPMGAARPLPRPHPPGPRGGRSCAPGSLPPAAGDLRTADPLSRRLAPCAAASRRARRGRSDARL